MQEKSVRIQIYIFTHTDIHIHINTHTHMSEGKQAKAVYHTLRYEMTASPTTTFSVKHELYGTTFGPVFGYLYLSATLMESIKLLRMFKLEEERHHLKYLNTRILTVLVTCDTGH